MSDSAISVATSIPPVLSRRNAGRAVDSAYQELCIRSWLDCGFRVLSVNHGDEIPALAASYPQVAFIETTRDASALSGRKMPYIADLLLALLKAPDSVVGIINSDVVFEPSSAWRTSLRRAAAGALVMGQRHDATSLLDGTFRKYYWGFDCFFFARDSAHDLLNTAMPFAMGLAWWDYWLPAALSMRGHRVLTLERPTIAHLIHKEPYLDESWRQLAIRFAEFIVREAAKHQGALPPSVAAVLRTCTELARVPELRWRNGGADALISQIAVEFIPAITSDVANMQHADKDDTPLSPGALGPASVFQRFDERLTAGEALERAKRLAREGRVAEARNDFRYVLERTARDLDALCAAGEFELRHGNAPSAVELLLRAIESEPEDGRAHCNLAVALHHSGRPAEAVSVLETALARRPDFAEAAELLRALRS